MSDDTSKKTLADYLPYEYRKKGEHGEDTDTLKFLKAFDRILLGLSDDNRTYDEQLDKIKGLEDEIAGRANFFDPALEKAPANFLPWLGQWDALSLRADII